VSTSMSADQPQSRLFGRFSLRDAPGWLVSLGVHLVLMVVLLLVKFNTHLSADSTFLNAIEDVTTETAFDATDTDQVGIGTEVTSLSATSGVSPGTAGADAGPSAAQTTADRVNTSFTSSDSPRVNVRLGGDELSMPSDDMLVASVGPGSGIGSGTVNVAGEGGGGVESAIDRLVWEITQSLHQSKTTVIWLFDQSLSLKERRDAIADRFENVYRQLESLEEGGKGALMTVAATYGEGFKLLTDKPLEDVKPLIAKVRAIPDDPSGKENVFAAVNQLVQKFKGERGKKRSVLIFIVTDEKGDDAEKHLEETITLCRKQGIRVYTVGNAALFGREKGYVTWKYPEGGTEDIEVDAGPETVEPEALVLGFWGGNGPDLSRMSSGYGPYALTRLCKESGGQYLIAQEDTKGQRFDPAVMRNYQPDYRPIRDYAKSLDKNKAKAALVMAAKQTKVENVPLPQLGFPAYNDNVLRETITESQKPAAELIYKVDRLVEVLKQGEKDREKVSEPRWRAAYDLAIGRALAMKVRSFGYNAMLAEMKSTPKSFQRKDSNEWRIEPSKTINAGQAVKKLEREAATYLKRVIDDNPGTPWEKLAARELSTPMGWEWKELKNPGIFPANTSQEEAKRQIRLAEEKAKTEAAKRPMTPQRDKPKL
jgi:hypothetical protein